MAVVNERLSLMSDQRRSRIWWSPDNQWLTASVNTLRRLPMLTAATGQDGQRDTTTAPTVTIEAGRTVEIQSQPDRRNARHSSGSEPERSLSSTSDGAECVRCHCQGRRLRRCCGRRVMPKGGQTVARTAGNDCLVTELTETKSPGDRGSRHTATIAKQ